MLLTRASAATETPGAWHLPGGGIAHGEHPADAVVREYAEQTGLVVAVTGLGAVVSDLLPLPRRGVLRHTDRIIYDVTVHGGTPRREPAGNTDLAAWLAPGELAALPVLPFTADLLGLPAGRPVTVVEPAEDAEAARERRSVRLAMDPAVLGSPEPVPGGGGGRSATGQRFAAYGLVTDPDGRVLLTLIADGFPGAGHWHLPGGGVDHGEQPAAGFLRELVEEAGQSGTLTALLDVSHQRRMAVGPEGYPLDWHAVRVLYRVTVDAPTRPRVTEAAGGSTASAAWFVPEDAARLPLTEIATHAMGRLANGKASVSELHS